MTPIKRFILIGNAIYVEDYSGWLRLVAMCPTQEDLEFTIHSLKDFHGVPAVVRDQAILIER